MEYHFFIIGFNFWYIAALALIALMFILGTRDGHMTKNGKKRHYQMKFYKIHAGLAAIIIGIMMVLESWCGIVQLFDNCLCKDPYTSSAWSIILAIVAVEFIAAIFYGLCLTVADYGRKVRHNYALTR